MPMTVDAAEPKAAHSALDEDAFEYLTSRMDTQFRMLHQRLDTLEFQHKVVLAGAFSAIATGLVTVLRFAHDLGVF